MSARLTARSAASLLRHSLGVVADWIGSRTPLTITPAPFDPVAQAEWLSMVADADCVRPTSTGDPNNDH